MSAGSGSAAKPPEQEAAVPAAEIVALDKRFPGVHALNSVSLEFREGEIHSVIGENGAGKSTLVNLLAGLLRPDSGSIRVSGHPVHFKNPRDARRGGVSVVPQDTHVIPTFSVGRSTRLGLEPFWVNRSRLTRGEAEPVRQALAQVGASNLSPDRPMDAVSVAQLRLCQIARTLLDPGRLIILDEPTAVLSEADAEALLERLVSLRDQRRSIVYISHRLNEVLRISDRITVLRDGSAVGTFTRGEVDRERLVQLMAREAKLPESTSSDAALGEGSAKAPPRLRAAGVTRAPMFADVNLEVRPGQIVGVAGVQGCGHGALLEALAGATDVDRGELLVDGAVIPMGSVRVAYQAGIRLVPQERRQRGIVGCRPLRENVALGYVRRRGRRLFRRHRTERAEALQMVRDLAINTPSLETLAGQLSGGNQQKVVLARMLGSDPRILLLSEPTQGIDVHAKAQILALIRALATEHGYAVVFASSEFEEVLEYADVIHVMAEGRFVRSFEAGQATYRDVLAAALP